MLTPAAPIAVGGSGSYQIPYPPTGGRWTQLKLENATAYGITVYYDGSPVESMAAGTVNVFPLTLGPFGAARTSSPVTPPSPQITVTTVSEPVWGDTPGTLRATFGQYGDAFPGVYPLALAAPGQAPSPYGLQTPEPYGTWAPYQSISVQLLSPGVSPVLPAAPAGNLYHIKWIQANAASTAYSASALLYLVDVATNYNFVFTYAQANGIQLHFPCDFFLGGGISLHNSTGATASVTLIYRTEPLRS